MHCASCGTPADAGTRFCQKCGNQIAPSLAMTIPETFEGSVSSSADYASRTPYRGAPRHSSATAERKPHDAIMYWIVTALLIVASSVVARYKAGFFNVAYCLGYTAGLLLVGLAFALIRRLFKKDGFGASILGAWGVAIALSWLGIYYGSHSYGFRLSTPASAELKAAVRHLDDAAKNQPETTADAGSSVDTQPAANETEDQATARIFNAMAANITAYQAQVQELQKETKELPVVTILTPAALTSSEGIQNGRNVVTRYGQLLDELQQSYTDYISATDKIIATAPEHLQTAIMAGYTPSAARSKEAIGNYVTVERQIIATITSILDLAEANLGQSSASNGQIYLHNDALATYQQLLGQLRSQAQDEQKALVAMRAMHQEGQQKFDKLRTETDAQ